MSIEINNIQMKSHNINLPTLLSRLIIGEFSPKAGRVGSKPSQPEELNYAVE
jgi:hypothetical protein